MDFPISLAEKVRGLARERPRDPAFIVDGRVLDWAGYDAAADRLARVFLALGLEPGERVAVWVPDGTPFHIAYQAAERCGLVCLGLAPRCGERELAHLLTLASARILVSAPEMPDGPAATRVARLRERGIQIEHHLILAGDGFVDDTIELDGRTAPGADAIAQDADALARRLEPRALKAADISLLNTTSGTTGLPKIVIHDQLRWFHYHDLATDVGHLDERDVFMSSLPAPVGFGLWTAHFTPTLLGAPTVLTRKFEARATIDALERHRVTVLAAVSTQFIMLLESGGFDGGRKLALRALFTGGEAVPERQARNFEIRTGARVLQFYGSNETGAVSATRPEDTQHKRLTTAGRPIPAMQLRLFDSSGKDVTASGRGQPAVKGPVVSKGYLGAPEANAQLITADGWVMLGDLVELDAEGYLRVIGRTDDIIIRGGKNLSAAAIEEGVALHPNVALAAAIGMPDRIFGERAAAYVELRAGTSLDLEGLRAHLRSEGIARELWPEALVVMPSLPRGVGGKIAKGALREDARQRFGDHADEDLQARSRAAERTGD
jgi:acyl-CoA synthetase